MCGRYVLVSKIEKIEKKFNVKIASTPIPNFNISPGNKSLIVTSKEPNIAQNFEFGFTPSWSKKKTYIINARAEGDNNKENLLTYQGGMGITNKPFFRNSIKSKRCLVIADAFIEGTTKEKLSKPYLVYLRNKQRPFAMAGIYDQWVNQETGEITHSFAVITCPPNKLMQQIPHHRMPVILNESDYSSYLSLNTSIGEVTELLKSYDFNKMNAFPISTRIKNPANNSKELVTPIGEPLLKEYNYKITQSLELEGWGTSPARKRVNKKSQNNRI